MSRSIIAFPEDFCVVDLETTGLMPEWDEIIEIGAIKVIGGKEADRFQSLVKPSEPLDPFITELTGITDEMLADAPDPEEVLPKFLAFLCDLPIVGYNVGFDVRFLAEAVDFENDYIDCMRLARKLHPEMEHHRLKDMKQLFHIDAQAHRAVGDCEATAVCYALLKEEGVEKYGSPEAFADDFVWKQLKHLR